MSKLLVAELACVMSHFSDENVFIVTLFPNSICHQALIISFEDELKLKFILEEICVSLWSLFGLGQQLHQCIASKLAPLSLSPHSIGSWALWVL